MAIAREQSELLESLIQQILEALSLIEAAAKEQLQGRHTSNSDVFALPDNPMVGRSQAAPQLGRIQHGLMEALSLLTREPFIAYVLAADDEGTRHKIFFSRTYSIVVANLEGRLVSYRAPLGRIAEVERGDSIDLKLPNGSMATYTILERLQLRPRHVNSQWDGLENQIEAQDLLVSIESLRKFLDQWAAAEVEPEDLIGKILSQAQAASTIAEGIRRRVIDRISLRDQPILDRYQGEIFRLPLNRRLMLTGPAGTGKTTTLIRRLAQKRSIDEVDEEERAQVPAEFFHPNNWIMFTPTTLLKLYLKEAFSREGVAASDERVRTWADERRRLGRDVFKILRSERGGRFTLEDDLNVLQDSLSPGLMGLTDAFETFFKETTVAQYDAAIQSMLMSADREQTNLANRVRGSVGRDSIIFENLFNLTLFYEELGEHIRKHGKIVEEIRRRSVNLQLSRDPNFLIRVADFLDELASQVEDEDDDDDTEVEDDQLLSIRDRRVLAERAYWRAIAALALSLEANRPVASGSKNNRLLSWLSLDPAADPQFKSLGSALLSLRRLRYLSGTFRNLVERIPFIYQRFRRASLKEGIWYRSDAKSALDRGRVTGLEIDVMLLLMLRQTRGFFLTKGGTRLDAQPGLSSLQSIQDQYATQVLVDEATDFSAVQLACMLELAHPTFRSLFASGDVRQRITSWGVRSLSELQWISSDFDIRQIDFCYRQSRQLAQLANIVAGLDGTAIPAIQMPEYIDDISVPAILGEKLQGAETANWLCERILEIERGLGKIPSIAIFVDGDEHIDPLLSSLRPLLAEHNFDIVGCKEGRIVGIENQIRIFDVQYIKGLEFEAVFFVGVDILAAHKPGEFAHYLYVGITRAATYLGITCEDCLPTALEPLRPHLITSNWVDFIAMQPVGQPIIPS